MLRELEILVSFLSFRLAGCGASQAVFPWPYPKQCLNPRNRYGRLFPAAAHRLGSKAQTRSQERGIGLATLGPPRQEARLIGFETSVVYLKARDPSTSLENGCVASGDETFLLDHLVR